MNETQKLIQLKKLLKQKIESKNSWGKNELAKVIDEIVDDVILNSD